MLDPFNKDIALLRQVTLPSNYIFQSLAAKVINNTSQYFCNHRRWCLCQSEAVFSPADEIYVFFNHLNQKTSIFLKNRKWDRRLLCLEPFHVWTRRTWGLAAEGHISSWNCTDHCRRPVGKFRWLWRKKKTNLTGTKSCCRVIVPAATPSLIITDNRWHASYFAFKTCTSYDNKYFSGDQWNNAF